MPWTYDDYPVSLKNFEPRVRNKAVDIANALLEEGYAEGSAIPIATAQAKRWAEGNDEESKEHYHVIPHPDGWAVRRDNAKRASSVFDDKEDARNAAIELARGEGVHVYIHGDGGEIEDHVKLLDETEAAKE